MSWEQPVMSKMCTTVGYDSEAKELIVTWNSGKRSAYSGVDEATALRCANAPSVGQYINSEIKPNYPVRYI